MKRTLLVSTATGKFSARGIVSNLVLRDGEELLYLTGYGPIHEMRSMAQILGKSFELRLGGEGKEEGERRFYGVRLVSGVRPRLVPAQQHYAGLFVLPDGNWLLGNTREECLSLFSRILDRDHLVHREWHPWLFSKLRELVPEVGSKACFDLPGNLQAIVAEGLAKGEIAFPEPTAHVVVPVRQEQETRAAEQETERAA